MAHTHLFLTHDNTTNQRGRRGKDLLRVALNKAYGCVSGVERGTNFTLVGSGTDPAAACTAGISASGSGTIGMSISGVALTSAAGGTDILSAALIAAVINASTDAKIQHLYGATHLKSTVTLATVLAGTTIDLAGFRFTAIAGTAAAIPTKDGDFVISGTDTQDGTSFCGAVNRHPYASKYLFALNVAGACHVYPKKGVSWFTGPNAPPNTVKASAATVTVGSATFAASTHYGVYAKIPGKWGNGIVIAASGTGQTIENGNTYFSRGLGMDAAPITDTL